MTLFKHWTVVCSGGFCSQHRLIQGREWKLKFDNINVSPWSRFVCVIWHLWAAAGICPAGSGSGGGGGCGSGGGGGSHPPSASVSCSQLQQQEDLITNRLMLDGSADMKPSSAHRRVVLPLSGSMLTGFNGPVCRPPCSDLTFTNHRCWGENS